MSFAHYQGLGFTATIKANINNCRNHDNASRSAVSAPYVVADSVALDRTSDQQHVVRTTAGAEMDHLSGPA